MYIAKKSSAKESRCMPLTCIGKKVVLIVAKNCHLGMNREVLLMNDFMRYCQSAEDCEFKKYCLLNEKDEANKKEDKEME